MVAQFSATDDADGVGVPVESLCATLLEFRRCALGTGFLALSDERAYEAS